MLFPRQAVLVEYRRRFHLANIPIHIVRMGVYIAFAVTAQCLIIFLLVTASTMTRTSTSGGVSMPVSVFLSGWNTNHVQHDLYDIGAVRNGTGRLYNPLNKTISNISIDFLDGPHKVEQDINVYFTNGSNMIKSGCFVQGTDLTLSNKSMCFCLPGWFGPHCSFPGALMESNIPDRFISNLSPRTKPRKLIVAFPFNTEFDMLEFRLHQLSDITDVFLVLESNYTAFGDPKPLYFLQWVAEGHFKAFISKIAHVTLSTFPQAAHKNGWVEDALLRNYISQVGMKHLKGISHDDLFVLNDADEVPSREVLLFLKLHDGYPEPVTLAYHWTVYGFFWKHSKDELQEITSAVSVGMLTHVYMNKAYAIRDSMNYLANQPSLVGHYLRQGGLVYPWTVGNMLYPAGFHCSWCSKPEGIRNKLLSAPNSDFPRWGSYPAKTSLQYIRKLIKTGYWFDNRYHFSSANKNDTPYAPEYFVKNWERYKYLLDNPY